MNLEWMVWTVPTAVFFIAIALMLLGMTVWEVRSPTVERRGLLPIATTRGDRLFISLLASAFVHLGWLALTDLSLWFATAISFVILGLLLRYG